MLVSSDKEGHYGATEIRYAGRHCPDDRYIWVILELWELHVVILEDTK